MAKYRVACIIILVLAVLGGGGAYWITAAQKEEVHADYIFEMDREEISAETVVEENDEVSVAPLISHGYSVSCSNDIVTDVGMSILEAGGNAVDAAVAMAYTLAVVEPYASGLGGSGGMLIYSSEMDECKFYDYRACAGSSPIMTDNVAVPGMVAGMEHVLNEYGTIPLEKLIEPAIYYAENGFPVYSALKKRLDVARQRISNYPIFYDENGQWMDVGDMLYQKDLAKTLKALQENGPDIFYHGYIAEDIAAHCSLSTEDFANYQVNELEALQTEYRGYRVYSANAPLSGVTVLQMLEMEEIMDLPQMSSDIEQYLTVLKQITASAYSDRYSILGDPLFSDMDLTQKLERSHIYDLLDIDIDEYSDDLESTETTSFSVVDRNGMVVSSTNTLSHFWGSSLMVDGIFLNNTNSNFSNCKINRYEPGKRSRTFTAPTIITGPDGYVLSIGTPGGNNIPSVLFEVLVDLLKYKIDPQEAVTLPRLIYRQGVLTVEENQDGTPWFSTTGIRSNIVWRASGYWWGSISLAGYSDSKGAFSAYDYRRGATKSGAFN